MSPAKVEPTPKATVVIYDDAYHPATVRIKPGSRVTWVHRDSFPVTAETDGVGFFEVDSESLDKRNVFDIHTLQQGEAESVEFDTPGKYEYHSSFDSKVKGVVEVIGEEGDR